MATAMEQDNALRDPEAVERVWTDEADGAWAEGKAPVHLLTSLLRFVQEQELEEAERTVREILEIEPKNELVQDLIAAMRQQHAMEEEADEEDDQADDESDGDSESDDDDEEEDSEAESDEGDCNDDEAAPQHDDDSEEKNNEDK